MNNDFDFIKNAFDNDGITAPDSLSEERIRDVLPDAQTGEEKIRETLPEDPSSGVLAEATPDNAAVKPVRKKTYKAVRNLAALAACLILAVLLVPNAAGLFGGSGTQGSRSTAEIPAVSDAAAADLSVFHSYGEIKKQLKKLQNESGFGWASSKSDGLMITEETTANMEDSAMLAAAADTGSAKAELASDAEGHSETYLQVAGVDEADIVKTDGKYIYYVNQNAEVIILSVENGETQKVATIGNGDVENYIHDIYLKDNTLITVGVVYEGEENSSSIVTYDISDPSAPKVINTFKQSGEIISSRMNGNYVYLVTNEYIYDQDRVVPMAGRDDGYAELNPGDICCVPDPKMPSYVILSAVDVSSGKAETEKKKLDSDSNESADGSACRTIAIFGASNTIYCNQNNLYTAVTEYSSDYSSTGTRIIRAGLDGLKIRFEACGKVGGAVYDQFAMDEKDGTFRIATTDTRDGITVNNLFVLDNNDLKELGKVTGFARNESIQAVRYIGDRAYVITFEQVDPLFVINLSDPANPVIDGEVEIEGFSSLLVPTAENRLLGIGYRTADNGYGGVYTDGLKLALFDISDPSAPKVLDSKEFQGMDSPAQYTHLALNVNSEQGYYAIPYSRYPQADAESGNADITGGVLVFGASDQIEIYDEHPLAQEELLRDVYIGNWHYALDRKGKAYSFTYPAGE